jgi:small-conductance mechanosensitive channel
LANADVLRARVRNLGRMPEKRYTIRLRLAYETPPALVERVPSLVEEAVRAVEGTRFVSCLLAQIGDYALEFEVIYFTANLPGRNTARTNDLVNRGILQRFAATGLNLAYPTRRQVS